MGIRQCKNYHSWEFIFFLLTETKYILFCIVQISTSSRRKEVGDDWSSWCLEATQAKIKKNFFDKDSTLEDMLAKCPDGIPHHQFRQLIEYWKHPTVQVRLKWCISTHRLILCHINFFYTYQFNYLFLFNNSLYARWILKKGKNKCGGIEWDILIY